MRQEEENGDGPALGDELGTVHDATVGANRDIAAHDGIGSGLMPHNMTECGSGITTRSDLFIFLIALGAYKMQALAPRGFLFPASPDPGRRPSHCTTGRRTRQA